MSNPWTTKMEQFTAFSDMEKRRLDELISAKQEKHAPKEDIIPQGTHVDHCHLVLSGLACRYKMLPDGGRQIMAFLIPGDLCDAEVFILKKMDHGIAAIAQTTTALIPADAMKALLRETSSLGEALWWGTMTDLGVLRERIVDEGRRNAYMRIAHLLYEMLVRYRMVGMTNGNSFVFPVSQIDLADATGLTSVHANRMLRKLRVNGLIKLEGGSVTIIDPDLLKQTAQFSGTYLHLDRVHGGGASTSPRAGDLV